MVFDSKNASGIAIGTWLFGNEGWGQQISTQDVITIVRKSFECGIRVFDTAPAYGKGLAEQRLGQAIRPFRDKVCLVTKCGLCWDNHGKFFVDNQPTTLLRDIDDSLRRLKTETVDVLLVHWPETKTPDEIVLKTLSDIKRSGKAKAIGLSNWPIDRLEFCVQTGAASWTQDPCNLVQPLSNSYQSLANTYNLVTMGYSPLAQGLLSAKYTTVPTLSKKDVRNLNPLFGEPLFSATRNFIDSLDQTICKPSGTVLSHLALKYVQSVCSLAVVGIRNLKQLDDITQVHQTTLDNATLTQIERVYRQTFENTDSKAE